MRINEGTKRVGRLQQGMMKGTVPGQKAFDDFLKASISQTERGMRAVEKETGEPATVEQGIEYMNQAADFGKAFGKSVSMPKYSARLSGLYGKFFGSKDPKKRRSLLSQINKTSRILRAWSNRPAPGNFGGGDPPLQTS